MTTLPVNWKLIPNHFLQRQHEHSNLSISERACEERGTKSESIRSREENCSNTRMPKNASVPGILADGALLEALYGLLGRRAELQLLFQTDVDGFNAAVFHQKCNTKGPTVTVIRLADQTVCGGYTPYQWGTRDGQYNNEPGTFLFRLKYRNQQPAAYMATPTSYSVHDKGSYGPTFGNGHDLMAFNGNAANGTHDPSSYTYPPDPQTGGSHPLTGGHPQLAGPGAYTVHVYQVLPTNLKAGGSRRGGSKYTPSTLPRPWIYPGTPQLDAAALSSLRDKLQVCGTRQPARCDAMQEPARSASLTAAALRSQPRPPPRMLHVRAG